MKKASHPASSCMKIGIVGAGIGGLSAAIALAKAGHQVEIFEKSTFANEVGAAINVCPNATRILSRWGFEFDQWGGQFEAQGIRVYNAETLEEVASVSYADFEDRFGSKFYLFHRVDLHSGLKELALNSALNANQVALRLRSEISEIDCEEGIMMMKDGSSYRKDLIVVAAGVHFANKITGKTAEVKSTGLCAFRWTIPKSKLFAQPLTREFLEASYQGINIATTNSIKHTRLVWYPCRDGELYNFFGLHPEKLGRRKDDGWTLAGSHDDLLETYKPFGERFLEVCRKAEDLKIWPLLYRPPLQTWTRGKAVLIGDAAHPMLPHQGQGGAQAIEDGAALGTLFAGLSSEADVPGLLQIFQDVRKERASALQIMSSVGQDQAKTIEHLVQPYIKGPVPLTYYDIHQFNFGHDVMLEAQKALEAAEIDGMVA